MLPLNKSLETRQSVVFLATALIYLYLTLFKLPATPFFFENDHFILMNDAVRMMGGETMYRDFFQFTFPGPEVWYLGLFSLFGQKLWLLNVTILVLGFGITSTLLAISRHLVSGLYVFIAPSFFLYLGFRWYGMDGGHRLFSCLFAMLAILMIIRRVSTARLIAAGAMAALSAYFTQTRGFGIGAAIGTFVIWQYFAQHGDLRRLASNAFIFSAAFGVCLLILISPFLVSVGPYEFFDSTILWAGAYGADPANNSEAYWAFWLSLTRGDVQLATFPADLFYYLLVPFIYGAVIVYYVIKRPQNREVWERLLLLSTAGIFLVLVTTGLSSTRLYHVGLPGLVIFGYWAARFRRAALAVTGLIIVAAWGLCLRGQMKTYPPPIVMPAGTAIFASKEAADRYSWLAENTRPGDVVFESFRSVVNFPLKLKNPTAFSMLRDSALTSSSDIDRVLTELRAQPPRFILWDATWSKPAAERKPGDNLEPLYQFLQSNYTPRAVLSPIYGMKVEVWEKID